MPSHVHQADYDRLENELATLRAENARLREGLKKAARAQKELERELADRVDHYKKLHSYWDAATDELSALKAKMEKVRQVLDETKRLRTDAFDPYVSSGKLLAILDGREG